MVYSRYYRHLLNEKEKSVYDALEKGLMEEKKVIVTSSLPAKRVSDVLLSVNMDHPELFWVDFNQTGIATNGLVLMFTPAYAYTEAQKKCYEHKLLETALSIEEAVNHRTIYDACLYIHDWLISHITYRKENQRALEAHSIIGALVQGSCVCEGYAKAFKYLADMVKIRCLSAVGYAVDNDGTRGGHAWNIVKVNGRYYHVDATQDQFIEGRWHSHACFLLSDQEILVDHELDPAFTWPVCRESGCPLKTIHGTRQLISCLEDACRKGASYTEVRLSKGFPYEKLKQMVADHVTSKDQLWLSHLRLSWFRDYGRTLIIGWE